EEYFIKDQPTFDAVCGIEPNLTGTNGQIILFKWKITKRLFE
ncbi:MAG: hypothetical protein RIQ94_821, partial [Pseudomonadota bacterium]